MRRLVIHKGRVAFGRETIPRADHLADVTSENPFANFVTQLYGDIVLEFDGEIGNAATRVEGAVWQNTIGRAGFDAARTGSTMVGYKRRVRFQFKIEQNFRK